MKLKQIKKTLLSLTPLILPIFFIPTISCSKQESKEPEKNPLPNPDPSWIERTPVEYRKFSEENSFRIRFQKEYDGYEQGTAWSWYIKNTGLNKYDWYLMTNLHVVSDAIAYQEGLQTSDESLDKSKF